MLRHFQRTGKWLRHCIIVFDTSNREPLKKGSKFYFLKNILRRHKGVKTHHHARHHAIDHCPPRWRIASERHLDGGDDRVIDERVQHGDGDAEEEPGMEEFKEFYDSFGILRGEGGEKELESNQIKLLVVRIRLELLRK